MRILFPDIHIEAAPNAGEGEVSLVTVKNSSEAHEYLLSRLHKKEPSETWAVLCRLTSPLVHSCLRCLSEGIPAAIKGRDIKVGLSKLIDEVAKDIEPRLLSDLTNVFALHLSNYIQRETQRLKERKAKEITIEMLLDKAKAVHAIFFSFSDDERRIGLTINKLKQKVEDLFNDSPDERMVVFSTIHRFKGLQAKRVAILQPELMPYLGKNPDQAQRWRRQEERNLIYVACTRAEDELIVLGSPASWLFSVEN